MLTNVIARMPARKYVLFVIIVWAGALRLALLNLPLERNAEGLAAFYGLLARNYFRYDLATTLGVPVMSMGAGAEPVFYANHSPSRRCSSPPFTRRRGTAEDTTACPANGRSACQPRCSRSRA